MSIIKTCKLGSVLLGCSLFLVACSSKEAENFEVQEEVLHEEVVEEAAPPMEGKWIVKSIKEKGKEINMNNIKKELFVEFKPADSVVVLMFGCDTVVANFIVSDDTLSIGHPTTTKGKKCTKAEINLQNKVNKSLLSGAMGLKIDSQMQATLSQQDFSMLLEKTY